MSLSAPTILQELKNLYSPPKSFLNWSNPLELVIATVMSAQCTDVRVNMVTESLFQKYRSLNDYLRVPVEELERDIYSTGHYHAKATYIQGLCRIILEKHQGDVPQTMEELIALPGVGRKTASIVLYAAFGKVEGIAIDTHVLRLSRRLGLTISEDPKKVELDLMKQVPKKDWATVNPLLISHGRAVCTARNRMCEVCVFRDRCPSSKMHHLPDLAKKT